MFGQCAKVVAVRNIMAVHDRIVLSGGLSQNMQDCGEAKKKLMGTEWRYALLPKMSQPSRVTLSQSRPSVSLHKANMTGILAHNA